MRILILNWKDIRHPEAGGAERVTHEYATHLVKFGHRVTIFTSHASSLPREQVIDGVRIIRRSRLWTVHLWAFIYYMISLRKTTDFVIDQIHGIPFFTPLYVKIPKLAYIHETAGRIWFKEFPPLIGVIGYVLEPLFFLFYKKIPFITVSQSTQNDLTSLGVPEKLITVIPNAFDKPPFFYSHKTTYPSICYVGRITPMKRLEMLIGAVKILAKHNLPVKVFIAGSGKQSYIGKLRQLAGSFNVTAQVVFLGKISERKKYQLLGASWVFVHPSLKEGFGLTIAEAASQKTPTVAFDVGGLRDTIQNGKTGIIVMEETPAALTQSLEALFKNRTLLGRLSRHAYRWSKSLPTWETQTKKVDNLLHQCMRVI